MLQNPRQAQHFLLISQILTIKLKIFGNFEVGGTKGDKLER